MDYITYKVNFHIEGVPLAILPFFRPLIIDSFVNGREAIVKIFNEKIEDINKEWDKFGEPAYTGKYIEDVNPKYVRLIKDRMQTDLDEINKTQTVVEISVDEYGDFIGIVRPYPNSKIYATLSK